MSLVRVIVYSSGIWWIVLGVPALGWLARALPPQHPLAYVAAAAWVLGVVPAFVLSGGGTDNLRVDLRAAWQALRTWLLIVGGIAAAGIVLSIVIRGLIYLGL